MSCRRPADFSQHNDLEIKYANVQKLEVLVRLKPVRIYGSIGFGARIERAMNLSSVKEK
jgi:hypothetical protein